MKRLVFFAPPFAGHLNPMVPLAEAVRSAGYAVSFYSGERKRAVLEARGFAFESLPSMDSDILNAISDTPERVHGNPRQILRQMQTGLRMAVPARLELTERWRAEPPDLVIADSVAIIAGLSAGDHGIPWITTVATPFAIENHEGPPPWMGGLGEARNGFERIRNWAGRKAIRGIKHWLAWELREELKALGLGFWHADGSEGIYSPYAILGFGMMELEFERDWPRHFKMIGPVFDNPEQNAAVPLPARPRILVSIGTHLPWAKVGLAENLAHLAAQRPGVNFVGSMGQPQRIGDAPVHVAPNAVLHPFVPYAAQLPQFDAVIHHGGTGVAFACVAAEKPAVVVPHDYDQFDVAARLQAHGAGVTVKGFRDPAMTAAIDRVLTLGAFPKLKDLAEACRRYRPKETFFETVRELLNSPCP